MFESRVPQVLFRSCGPSGVAILGPFMKKRAGQCQQNDIYETKQQPMRNAVQHHVKKECDVTTQLQSNRAETSDYICAC